MSTKKKSNSSIYKCKICQKEYSNKISYNSHQVLHRDKNYKCKLCEKKFFYLNSLNTHMVTHLPPKDLSECHICNKKFLYKNSLRNHMHIHGKKKFNCAVCKRGFSTKFSLERHEKIHKEEKIPDDQYFTCDLCHKKLASKDSVRNHIQFVHSAKNVACPKCGKMFNNKYYAKQHTENCKNILKTRKNPKRKQTISEKRTRSVKVKVEKISVIEEHFSDDSNLDDTEEEIGQSKKISPKKKRRTGNKCSSDVLKSYITPSSDKEKGYECSICNKSFSNMCNIMRHMNSHSKEIQGIYTQSEIMKIIGLNAPDLNSRQSIEEKSRKTDSDNKLEPVFAKLNDLENQKIVEKQIDEKNDQFLEDQCFEINSDHNESDYVHVEDFENAQTEENQMEVEDESRELTLCEEKSFDEVMFESETKATENCLKKKVDTSVEVEKGCIITSINNHEEISVNSSQWENDLLDSTAEKMIPEKPEYSVNNQERGFLEPQDENPPKIFDEECSSNLNSNFEETILPNITQVEADHQFFGIVPNADKNLTNVLANQVENEQNGATELESNKILTLPNLGSEKQEMPKNEKPIHNCTCRKDVIQIEILNVTKAKVKTIDQSCQTDSTLWNFEQEKLRESMKNNLGDVTIAEKEQEETQKIQKEVQKYLQKAISHILESEKKELEKNKESKMKNDDQILTDSTFKDLNVEKMNTEKDSVEEVKESDEGKDTMEISNDDGTSQAAIVQPLNDSGNFNETQPKSVTKKLFSKIDLLVFSSATLFLSKKKYE